MTTETPNLRRAIALRHALADALRSSMALENTLADESPEMLAALERIVATVQSKRK